MRVIARVKGLRRSASKIAPILDVVRGKQAADALNILAFMPTPAARDVAKVVKSAIANAENNFQMFASTLKIVAIQVDGGPMLKRFKPRSRGRVSPILRRSCHITVAVDNV